MIKHKEHHRTKTGENLRDFILGAQDGIVNILGLVLGVASATLSSKVVIISGLAGLFAESISMGAVAFTSSTAGRDFYRREMIREKHEMKTIPHAERDEIREIYREKGFKGKELESIVSTITSNKKVWLNTMMTEELGLSKKTYENPVSSSLFVLLATLIGSAIPLIAFFLLPVKQAILTSVVISAIALFAMGAVKAKITIGDWRKTGVQLLIIGLTSAVLGFVFGLLIGHLFGASPIIG